jgi:glycosyltransferase 2 family protein
MSKKRILSLLKIIVSGVLLVVVFTRVGWTDIVSTLARVNLGWLGLSLAIYVAGVFVRAVRWRFLLPRLNAPAIRIRRLAELYFVSFFFNSFLPTGIGGDVVRIAEVAPAVGLPAAASSVIADRAMGLAATSLLALFALPFVGGRLSLPLALITGASAIGVPVAFWLLTRYRSGELSEASYLPSFVHPLVRQVSEIAKALAAYTHSELGRALAVSLVFAMTNVLNYACIGAALQIDLSLVYYMLVSPVITLVLLIPISINGLGTRDLTYQALFVPVGVAPQDALAMSLAYHALNLITAVIGGAVYALMGMAEAASKEDPAQL